ncbi:hypothetical protein Neosp_015216 [[Neocosmospora] mangrovei]
MAPSKETLDSSRPNPDFERIIKNGGPPPLPHDVDIQLLRKITSEAREKDRRAIGGPPPGVTEQDIKIPVRDGTEILARVFAPDAEGQTALPILIFFHGGGFCIGNRYDDLESNRAIAARAKVVVVSLEYRLAPEHPFPQAIHDGLDSLHWIAKNASQVHPLASPSAGIIVGGTSAGGNIANSVVYINRDQGSPAPVTGQFLSVAPLVPSPLVPDKYKDDHISPEQNKAVSIPSPELAKLFMSNMVPHLRFPTRLTSLP